ncbi:hypothetical protein BaRGS_00009912, partial [Batillaria attramentaria]
VNYVDGISGFTVVAAVTHPELQKQLIRPGLFTPGLKSLSTLGVTHNTSILWPPLSHRGPCFHDEGIPVAEVLIKRTRAERRDRAVMRQTVFSPSPPPAVTPNGHKNNNKKRPANHWPKTATDYADEELISNYLTLTGRSLSMYELLK